jgi:hypothetical protein
MKKSNHIALRAILRGHPDGLTVQQLAKMLNGNEDSLNRSLGTMPDAYIDRWIRKRSLYAAVWCVVIVPPNCPRPDAAEKRYGPVRANWVDRVVEGPL